MLKLGFVLVLLVVISCSAKNRKAEVASSCVSFQWDAHPQLGPKAAMMVPVTVNGKELTFQLDTGSDVTMIYNKDLIGSDLPTEKVKEWDVVHVPVKFSQMNLGKQKIFVNKNMGDGSKGPSGTIGTDIMKNKTFLVNYSTSQVCLFEHDQMPAEFTSMTTLVPAKVQFGKIVVPVSASKTRDLSLFFDTGASAIPVFIDEPAWKEIVKKKSKEEVFKATSWGKEVPFVGKPPQATLLLGNSALNVKKVFYRKDKPLLFKEWNNPGIEGSFGNEAVWNREWIYLVFDSANPQFGLGPETE